MEFDRVPVPTRARSGRTPLPNPFVGVFPADTEALTFVVSQGADSVEARRLIRQARQAAKAVDRSAQIRQDNVPGGGVRFTVWTVARITRA